jgi:hypothetical protein
VNTERKRIGRPKAKIDEKQAFELFELGFTTKEVAGVLGIAQSTLDLRISQDAPFSEAVKSAKCKADAEVLRSLFKRACGFKYITEKASIHRSSGAILKETIEVYVPPDTMACIYWLNNRRKIDWRQRGDTIEVPAGKRLIIEDSPA